MSKGFVLVCLVALLNTTSAVACDIVKKREIHVGGSKGVGGKCSNSGKSIHCISEGKRSDRFNCNGPEGNFSGPFLKALISTACGCGASSDDGAAEQLRQELEDS